MLSDAERQELLAEAQAEFPEDGMMREMHSVRLLHSAQLQNLSPAERVEHLNRLLPSSTDRR